MDDHKSTINDAKKIVRKFIEDRDWQQFHSPKNLSMGIATEAAELMEHFIWVESKDSLEELEKRRQAVEDEAADVFWALLSFCNISDIDLAKALEKKLESSAKKYPIEKSKGKTTKYTEL